MLWSSAHNLWVKKLNPLKSNFSSFVECVRSPYKGDRKLKSLMNPSLEGGRIRFPNRSTVSSTPTAFAVQLTLPCLQLNSDYY